MDSVLNSTIATATSLTQACMGLFIVFLLLIIPSQVCWGHKCGEHCTQLSTAMLLCTVLFLQERSQCGYPSLLDWDTVQHKLLWNRGDQGWDTGIGVCYSRWGRSKWVGQLVYWSIGHIMYIGSGSLVLEIWLILLDW